jgi:two-component system CheB/CheR fusion protein
MMLDSIKSLESNSPTPESRGLPSAPDEEHSHAKLAFQLVGIGASAGGLEACSSFLDNLPPITGMAFVLVQHLDPGHQSLLVNLLTTHTSLVVREAVQGMLIEPDHLYIIPPTFFLTVDASVLHLVPTPAHRSVRLPFDMLLHSMAKAYGARASCIVMSGTGTDGSAGLLAIKAAGGLVIAQEPGEAGSDGMPLSAIATGAVDAVLTVAAMHAALAVRGQLAAVRQRKPLAAAAADCLSEIIDLLRTHTNHDFTLYKHGTLKRRVERRMAMASITMNDMGRYVTLLRNDPAEGEQLARDLLIHVTSFFRDQAVFEEFARTIVPELIRGQPPEQTLRIWVAGCSTGEEAYSIAMVFHEQIAVAGSDLKLQILASDADADAISSAREGVYPLTIEADVSPARLAAYFIKVNDSYRIVPELRATIVFTVQNLLADPPFSRLDFVSCRNVLIYLGPEAQRKVIALFHFGLRLGGVLMLGSSETVGESGERFEVISKSARLYKHIGRSRPGDVDFARHGINQPQPATHVATHEAPSRPAMLEKLCMTETMEAYAPATVLVTRKYECLYSLGATERYLKVASGHANLDVLAMVGEDVRTRLRSAMLRAIQDNAPVVVMGGRTTMAGRSLAFNIKVRPVHRDDEDLLLIHFVDHPERDSSEAVTAVDGSRVTELENELKSTKEELQGAVRSLEILSEEQKTISENALSVGEEFQLTNEELLTSKEELQSLNEELTALNSQLQETLEQQRTTGNDLQNVLYSTDVAKLVLDSELKIRFFTPATKALFSVIKTDIGRPLADLHSLASDTTLAADALTVFQNLIPVEHEVETPTGIWARRILPYRTHEGTVEGVVVTFTDITDRRHAAQALEAAKGEAERANDAKSRFLAAASHDLRQPLQTLALLQGLLASRVKGSDLKKLVAKLDDTVGAMSGMLNTLLDINQIEAGIVQAKAVEFDIDDLLKELQDMFTYQAKAVGLDLRVVPCGLTIRSDPRLLEQMLRNLVSNALKYTPAGKVLLGCRRNGISLRIEVWDTGIGIPSEELKSVFEEYHQLDNVARERSRGLGLGLSIVSRLGVLLDHPVSVRSRPGKGSVFSVEVPLIRPETAHPVPAPSNPTSECDAPVAARIANAPGIPHAGTDAARHRTGMILVVEDDPQVRDLLALLLADEGHRTHVVPDGPAAIDLVERGNMRPDLLITDYNLPGGMDGLAVAAGLRARLGGSLPVITLTGDISTSALHAIAGQQCLQLSKPVKPAELMLSIQKLLTAPAVGAGKTITAPRLAADRAEGTYTIFIVDDDRNIRDTIRLLLENDGRLVHDFATGEAFLAAYTPGSGGCLLIDAYLPGMSGLQLLQQLRSKGDPLPAIMITGSSDVAMAVFAMKAGAADFIEKPIGALDLIASIDRALERSRDSCKLLAWQASAAGHIADLTPRQHQIMDLVLAGHPSKNIAADLGISQRTVENHRASIMRTTGTRSLPALARLALAASANEVSNPASKPSDKNQAQPSSAQQRSFPNGEARGP